MTRAAFIAVLLFAIGWIAAAWGPAPSPGARTEPPRITQIWRRTAQGWEKAVWRDRICVPPYEPALHPMVVGAFEVLVALTLCTLSWRHEPEVLSPRSPVPPATPK